MSIHLVISRDEKYAIVNALAFYDFYHNSYEKFDADKREEWKECFKAEIADGILVDKLATKIANIF